MYEELKRLSNDLKADMIRFCQDLISTPALPGKEKEISELYLNEMIKLGYDDVFRDEWGNVIGIIKGNASGPTIMYNGHLDHVDPGEVSEWAGYDPYGGEIDENLMFNQDMDKEEMTEVIHGRGAADIKSGAAAQIYSGAALIKLREKGYKLKGNFLISMVVMEETAEMLGMIKLMEDTFPSRGINIDGVISSEATSLKLILGHRGRVEMKVTISGATSHASAPWLGINAVNKATRFIDEVEKVVKENGHRDEYLGKSSIALTIINCTPGALAIVPDRCHITYDRRFVPGETVESCISEIQRVIDRLASEDKTFRASVEVSTVTRVTYTGKEVTLPNQKEAWTIDQEHPFVKACAVALEKVEQPVKYGHWHFGTDLPVICARYNKPAIGYSGMQEYYVHRPIEKVRIDYLEKSIIGYASMFLELSKLSKDVFKLK